MKLLLYCAKAKNKYDRLVRDEHYGKPFYLYGAITENFESLNGKIVAECDYEVEKINVTDCTFRTFNLVEKEILNKSCLTYHELFEYLKNRVNPRGYAIHIKNLHIFDKPRELRDYYTMAKKVITPDGYSYKSTRLDKVPQNMMYCCSEELGDYILISIKPEWLCKILNKEKTIEVRKKVLKEMLK